MCGYTKESSYIIRVTLLQKTFEAVKLHVPKQAHARTPFDKRCEGFRSCGVAGAPNCMAAARKPRLFQDIQMLGYGRMRDIDPIR